jgi:ATP-dependent helicase/nuclease subunit A
MTSPHLSRANRGARPPDQAERDRIVDDLDTNILVEASAGTGKTTSLVARMINLIRLGKCTIDKLAAVTFTRKAAAELRGRFQVGLELTARAARGDEQRRLAAAAEHFERCFLGTIHAFCARLIRERPVEAGVDAEFVELDEATDEELRRQAWAENIARLLVSDDPLVAELDELGVDLGRLAPTFEQFAKYPDVAEWPAEDVAIPDPTFVLPDLARYVQHMKTLAPTLPDDPGNDKLIPEYRRLPRLVRQADLRRPAELNEVLEVFLKRSPGIIQRNWPGETVQATVELAEWTRFADKHVIPYINAMRRARYRPVLRALEPAVTIYDELRRAAGGLNFQDLLLTAATMLRANPPIRRYFRGRFTHLLIDEFQDTDPIQAEVMLLLTADDPDQTDWRRCRPVSGSLFVVGDPKQAIYRFRRADIVTYNEVKRIITESGGSVVSLTANFRTTEPLIGWINQTFAARFPSSPTEVAPAYSPLELGRVDERGGELAGLYQLNVPGSNKDEVVAAEAGLIARTIRHALDVALTVPRPASESEAPATAQPGDFLIVARNTTNLNRYAKELLALGIPHQVTGGTALNELDELGLLASCLRAVARPDDPLALVAVLRSELFGISDATLYAFKRAGGRFSFRSPVPEHGLDLEVRDAIRDAYDRLSQYYKWLFLLPPTASIEKITADLGLWARACVEPGGDVRGGSLAKALELVRAAQAERDSVTDLVEYLDGLVNSAEKHDGIPVRPAGAPVVRVMNLHKVKGLEAPVVFLADPSGRREYPVELHIDRSGTSPRGYMAVYEPKQGDAPRRLLACPRDWEWIEEAEAAFQRAENDRLLYVAATRAGACLTIAQRESRVKENPWQPFADCLADCAVHQDPGPQSAPARPQITVTVDQVATECKAIDERWKTVRRVTIETEKMKEIALARAGAPSERRPGVTDPPDIEDDAGRSADPQVGEHGVEWGEDLHALLEAAMRQPDVPLDGLARSLTRERYGDESRVEALLSSVRAIGQSAIWRRAQASERVLVEVPLIMMIPASAAASCPTVLRRGAIDLAFLEPQGWVIVDYKTDLVEPGALPGLVDHYRPQVRSYAAAWQSLVQQPVHEAGLFFTRANSYHRVDEE